MMTWLRALCRLFLLSSALFSALFAASVAAQPDSLWRYFKENFVSAEGRVIDTYQANISHSEGQGYGLLLAVKHNDLATFKRIWAWTKSHLQVREDALFAWQYRVDESGAGRVGDHNNATDGDLLIAWALLQGAAQWQQPDYRQSADAIQQDLIAKTMVEQARHFFLLPAEQGFKQGDKVRLNPSYLVFPAYQSLANSFSGPWRRLFEDAHWLLDASLHPDLDLPSDWLAVDQTTGRVDLDAQFSAEAIRVWLYAALINNRDANGYPGFAHWHAFFQKQGYFPDRFDAKTMRFEGHAMPGYWAVSARVLDQLGLPSATVWQHAHTRLLNSCPDYYSTALYLLAVPSGSPWSYAEAEQ